MTTLLTKLENNEAILLMYLANELPAEDREEVEQLLDRDENMRQHLQTLRAAYAEVDHAIGQADRETPLPSAFAAARAFGDVARRRAEQMPSIDEKEEYTRRRYTLFLYPVAAAALIAMGMLAWFYSATQQMNERNYVEIPLSPEEVAAIDWWNPQPADPSLVEVDQQLAVLDFLERDTLR